MHDSAPEVMRIARVLAMLAFACTHGPPRPSTPITPNVIPKAAASQTSRPTASTSNQDLTLHEARAASAAKTADACAAAKLPAPTKVLDVSRGTSLVSDGTHLWWTTVDAVWTASMTGMGAKVLVSFPEWHDWRAVAAHEGDVFVAASRGGTDACSFLRLGMIKSRKVLAPGHCVWRAAADGRHLAWVRLQTEDNGNIVSSIWVAPVTGGKPALLVGSLNGMGAIALEARFVYFASDMAALSRIDLDSQSDQTGTTAQRLTPSLDPAQDIRAFTVKDGSLYAFTGDPRFYGLIRLSQGSELKWLVWHAIVSGLEGNGLPQGNPVVVGRQVYWAQPRDGLVRRADTQGKCPAQDVAAKQLNPDYLLAVGQDLYWMNRSDSRAGAIMKLTLPGSATEPDSP